MTDALSSLVSSFASSRLVQADAKAAAAKAAAAEAEEKAKARETAARHAVALDIASGAGSSAAHEPQVTTATPCTDDAAYVDPGGYSCVDWVGYDCEMSWRASYLDDDSLATLRTKCHKACGLCVTEACGVPLLKSISIVGRDCGKDVHTALNERDCFWRKDVDDVDEPRAEWVLRPGNTYSFSWGSDVAPPVAGDPPCTDDSAYVGGDGYSCADWDGYTCGASDSALDVERRQKCRKACGLCTKVLPANTMLVLTVYEVDQWSSHDLCMELTPDGGVDMATGTFQFTLPDAAAFIGVGSCGMG